MRRSFEVSQLRPAGHALLDVLNYEIMPARNASIRKKSYVVRLYCFASAVVTAFRKSCLASAFGVCIVLY